MLISLLAMKIKTKLRLSLGLLFLLIILLSGLGMAYISALNKDTQNILAANYNTLDYSREMQVALDLDIHTKANEDNFAKNLQKQEGNITESGEMDLTRQLAMDFEKVKTNPAERQWLVAIRKDLTNIMLLNMQAIQRKSDKAKQTAGNAIWWIGLTGAFCFIISFTLLAKMPGIIANPIRELTESIKQIAADNYSQRVYFEGRGEFGDLAAAFNTMAQKLEEYNNSNFSKILFEKKRIETLINNMHDPVIGLDEKKNILFVNDEALKTLGMKATDLTGKPVQDIALVNDLMRTLGSDLPSTLSAKGGKEPLKIYADGKESYFEKEIIPISILPTGESKPKHIGHFIVLRNITPFKELDFAKTNFIATISHELKTPISTIKASLQLLENAKTGLLNVEQLQLIESIKDDGNRLLKITSELLNMAQVETGNIQLSIQQNDPVQILHYALEAVKVHAEQKQILLEIQKSSKALTVKADAEKTAWVLINLLTNAIRYSSEKSRIMIEIKEEENFILFSVKDSGQGIESKYMDKIFNRYFQIPGSTKSGTGLGLAISKEFIEAQGGKIWVESEMGLGSRFVFSLLT
jgi:NtrC-family two-component system sensor histidine kinase KinB